nr:4-deoxy-4-formamido-L-arabinose-phosphoundecaprenol deformylase [uncultured Desulfobacter sp.]
MKTRVGLRIDVDTLRGTRKGVPALLDLMARHQVRGSFFFSVGPDNMGRHLWRLVRPAFLVKMFRTKAAGLYGWDILLKGTLWPGPVIGEKSPEPMRRAAKEGHEVGLHAWDHHRWQSRIEKLDTAAVAKEIRKGYALLEKIIGRAPDCFAAPAWKVTPQALAALEQFPFRFESDCRGTAPFYPVIAGRGYLHPQVPTTLPTYDELVGRQCTLENYNDHLLSLIQPGRFNVLTIHAEAEGILCLDLFDDFLTKAAQRGIGFAPLGEVYAGIPDIETSHMTQTNAAGREGWISCQDARSEPCTTQEALSR